MRKQKTSELRFLVFETFRPLATSTPDDQRLYLTPPICSSTPKQTRRQPFTSIKYISQRRLQFNNKTELKIWHL